jgi:hypothetical protein
MNITTNKGDVFSDLAPLNNAALVSRACIYTIWTMSDIPNQYTLLYIGQTGDAQARLDKTHHKYSSWTQHMNNGLFVAFQLLPSNQYTIEDRLRIESTLIYKYQPVCNG